MTDCNDDCCQVAFCTVCELIMQPVNYYVNPKNRHILVEVKCDKCGQVGVSGVRKQAITDTQGRLSKTAVIRAF